MNSQVRSSATAMGRDVTKRQVSRPKQALIELMQRLNHGTIEGLPVRGGEPVLDPRPRCRRTVKFGGENTPRREYGLVDFSLKSEVVELFEFFDRLGDGAIDLLEVRNGLPVRMVVAAV
jgi:hypothetical protein